MITHTAVGPEHAAARETRPNSAIQPISVAIPTYGREQVLVDTIEHLLALEETAAEILIIDQTEIHAPAVQRRLLELESRGLVRRIYQTEPSITKAMNRALIEADQDKVVFFDDDIIPHPGLLRAHLRNYEDPRILAVVGQVLQPGQQPSRDCRHATKRGIRKDIGFPFHCTVRQPVANCMAGNLSVRRKCALSLGGFDENFVRVAYRFETEFARRVVESGRTVMFEPEAAISHLRCPAGGTRSFGQHLIAMKPDHSVGDYYFALKCGRGIDAALYMLRRFFREVATKYHLSHPWWILPKWLGEIRGFLWAVRLHLQGPKLLPGIEGEATA